MTLQETLSNLNWGGEGYACYQGYGQQDNSGLIDLSGSGLDVSPPAGTIPISSIAPWDIEPGTGTITPINISAVTGTTTGNSAFDLGGFLNGITSNLPGIIKAAQGTSGLQALGNGQFFNPNTGTVVGTPTIAGNSGLILLIGAAVLVLVLVMRPAH